MTEETNPALAEKREVLDILITAAGSNEKIIREGEYCRENDYLDRFTEKELEKLIKIYADSDFAILPGLLAEESEAWLLSYYRVKEIHHLEHAVAIGSLIAYHVSLDPGNSDRGILLSVFARSLLCLWQVERNDKKLLDDSIYYCRKAVELGPLQEPNRALHLYDLGDQLTARYAQQHDSNDYAEAKDCFQKASALRPAGKPVFMFRWARLIRERDEFNAAEKAQMLRNYISKLKEAISSESSAFVRTEYRVSISNIWWHVGWAMWERWELKKDPQDLDHAISVFAHAREAPRHGQMERFRACQDLARVTALRFARNGSAEDGTSATEMFKEALRIVPDSSLAMECLGNHLRAFAKQSGSEEMLAESVDILDKAIGSVAAPNTSLIESKVSSLMDRFERSGKGQDIDEAIRVLDDIIHPPHEEVVSYANRLIKHSRCLTLRYESLKRQDDFDHAQSMLGKALLLDEMTSDLRSQCLHAQGKLLIARYKSSNHSQYLDQAIQQIQEALKYSEDPSDNTYLMHHDLAIAYHLKFKTTMILSDLSSSINESDLALQALNQTSSAFSTGSRLMVTHGLANSLIAQFEVTEQQEDIDKAIASYEQCLQGAPQRSQQYIMRASNLSSAYQKRYNLTGEMDDIKRSQSILLEILSWGTNLSPETLCNIHDILGRAFLFAYFKCDEKIYLDYATQNFRKALATGSTAPTALISPSVNLTHALRHKAIETKNETDQTAAILQAARSLQYAVSLKDTPRMNIEGIAVNIVELVLQGWEDSGFSATSRYGKMYQSLGPSLLPLFETIHGSALVRFYIYAALANHIVSQDSRAACDMIRVAADLLPKAILLCHDRRDVLHNLGNFVALPSFAISYSLEAGYPASQALELFDKIRSVMWDHIITSQLTLKRKVIDDFPAFQARIERFQRPAVDKSHKPVGPEVRGLDQSLVKQQHEAYRQSVAYQQILHELRSDPALEGFLRLPGDISDITELAQEGPIIVISYGLYRSDAIIVRQSGVESLRLTALNGDALNQCEEWYLDALQLMGADLEAATEQMDKLLEWLWDGVAEPILKHLNLEGQQSPGEELPRSWWITTGKFGMFPLHAAGNPKKGPGNCVLDRTIPSYINSLRALAYTRSRRRNSKQDTSPRAHARSLLISMGTTPEMGENADLPSAEREVAQIKDIIESRGAKAKLLRSPNRDAAVQYLVQTDYAHFACHGVCDGDDPVRSALRLNDWVKKPLDVETLLQQTDMKCQLVYLTACESASNKSKFRDEGLHLAGGFQMAGVPHVIATLWQVDDTLSVEVAMGFYKALGAMGSKFDPSQSAKALREAIQTLRASGTSSVLWAAYIHYGP